jgi:hypothetical protein
MGLTKAEESGSGWYYWSAVGEMLLFVRDPSREGHDLVLVHLGSVGCSA